MCGCVIFVARLARPPLVGCADFLRLMFLLCWLAWRAHAVWVLLALLYFYCVHAFFSELEVSLSPELSDTLVVEDVGTSKIKNKVIIDRGDGAGRCCWNCTAVVPRLSLCCPGCPVVGRVVPLF